MGGAKVNAPLSSHLLLSLYSFLFGVFGAALAALLRSAFSALRLLPCTEKGGRLASAFRIPGRAKRTRKCGFYVGYFFYDLLCGVGFFALYMLFLYAYSEGVFRLYSLLLAVLGLFLAKAPAMRLFSFPTALLGASIRFFPFWIYRIFKRLRGKGGKKLDENRNIV